MKDKKCLVYNKYKNLTVAQDAVDLYCDKILTNADSTIKQLQKLCGAVCYSSLFLVADYDLVDKKAYTFENVCYHVPGLLKRPLHEFLENLSDVCFEGTCISDCLKAVLHECMYAEIIDLLKLNAKDTYCALFYMYCKITERNELLGEVVSMWNDDAFHIIKIWNYFESEVYNFEC